MCYRLLADCILILHFLFISFVLVGGLLCLVRVSFCWIHLPAVIWGVLVEWFGWICPLTPLENHFRSMASEKGFTGGFVEHYLLPVLYPGYLNPMTQWLLGAIVISVNILIYLYVFFRIRNRH